jgi:hypothetical protein
MLGLQVPLCSSIGRHQWHIRRRSSSGVFAFLVRQAAAAAVLAAL